MEQIIIKKKKFIVKNNIKMYNIDIDQIYFFEKFESFLYNLNRSRD